MRGPRRLRGVAKSPGVGLCAALAAGALLASGCGGASTNGQVFPSTPAATGTLSAAVAGSAVIRDLTATRTVMDASAAADAVSGLYALINRAGNQSVRKGNATLYAGVPREVGRFEANYRQVLRRLRALHFRTKAGSTMRDFDVSLIEMWHRVLPGFRSDIARAQNPWAAVIRFSKQGDRMIATLKPRLKAFLAGMTPAQQKVMERAMTQMFGVSTK